MPQCLQLATVSPLLGYVFTNYENVSKLSLRRLKLHDIALSYYDETQARDPWILRSWSEPSSSCL
jgi:hypothetical protein